ncbi:hypothetical protein ACFYW9_19150 [Streptomyces sp. NPDC002698]|uniref:hypothetical protein n=1 Tax=Streptomyces sp. NPDC002698 TaxID=3364660 RepID=UPI0036D0F0FC
MSEKTFRRHQIIYDRSSLCREPVRVVRYTAHGLIEIKDVSGRKGWINPDDARKWEW